MIRNQNVFDLHEEMIIDNFAGGGGASTGIELALRRCVDIAINHDPEAIAMHQANHPQTRHLVEDVFQVNPLEVCGWHQDASGKWVGGRRVGFGWFSPDCKHFSKAKGGQPRSKKIRGLAWVVVKWAMAFRKAGIPPPRVMGMENVEEFKTWGPLLLDGKPCSDGQARTFECFRSILTTGVAEDHPDLPDVREALGDVWDEDLARRGLGYAMESREIRASTTRAPTIRKRLYIILRCDGRPIVWPEATHGDPKSAAVKTKERKPWGTAADCIDWSIPCRSIFERNRPLAPATLRRIARGIEKFVLNSPDPFIVRVAHGEVSPSGVKRWGAGVHRGDQPMGTVACSNEYAIAVPHVTKFRTGSIGAPMTDPMPTVTAGPKENPAGAAHALGVVSAHLIQTGYGERAGQAPRTLDIEKPLGTVVGGGQKHAVVEACLAPFLTEHANASAQRNFPADEPLRTQCGEVKGGHFAEVTAFLAKHYGGHETPGSDLAKPIDTVTAVDHNALVTATIVGCGGRMGQSPPRAVDGPLQTLTAKADSCLVTAQVIRTDMPKSNAGCVFDPEEPLRTVTGGGNHIAEVRAFLVKYYGNEKEAVSLEDPMHTITSKDRLGLVTIHGEEYVITDIGMRMLEPHELYRAQGFPLDYIIAPMVPRKRGKKIVHAPLPKHAQVRMCGNSVCPPVAEALVAANVPELIVKDKGERAA